MEASKPVAVALLAAVGFAPGVVEPQRWRWARRVSRGLLPGADILNGCALNFSIVGDGYVGCKSRDTDGCRTVWSRDNALVFVQTTSDGK